jgi:hypothetical protein
MRDRNDQKLGEALKDWLSEGPLQRKYAQSTIRKAWEDKMGALVIQNTSALTLNDGVVRIKIKSSVLKQELHMGRDKILVMLKDSCPEVYVKEIVVY